MNVGHELLKVVPELDRVGSVRSECQVSGQFTERLGQPLSGDLLCLNSEDFVHQLLVGVLKIIFINCTNTKIQGNPTWKQQISEKRHLLAFIRQSELI